MDGATWAMLLALSVIWGFTFICSKLAVTGFPTATLVVLRTGLGALTLLVILRARGVALPRGWPLWRAFAGMGVLNNLIPFTLLFWSLKHIPAGLSAILNAATPLFSVFLAHWLTREERLSGARLAGAVTGIAGVALLVGPQPGDMPMDLLTTLAELAGLGAALSYAFSGIYGRRFAAMAVTPVQTAFGQLAASFVVAAPAALLIDQPWTLPQPSTSAILGVLALAIIGTGFAYILFFRILAAAGATNVMLVTLLVPVTTLTTGIIVLGEPVSLRALAGFAIIACGLALIDGRALRLLRR